MLVASACGGAAPEEVRVTGAAGLTRALAAAGAGDVVRLTGTRVSGAFAVPPGVRVVGDPGAEVVARGGAAFRLSAGEPAPGLSGLRIVGEVGAALVVFGEGGAVLEDLEVEAARGVGLAAEGVRLELRRMQIRGPLQGAADPLLRQLGAVIDPSLVAVAGLVVAGGRVDIEDLEVVGFAGFGALFHGTAGEWRGGSVRGCVGSGVLAEGSDLQLREVEVADGLVGRKVGFAIAGNGLCVAGDAVVETQSVTVRDVHGPGVLQDGATSRHMDLVAEDNGWAGVWVQRSPGSEAAPALAIDGAGSRLQNNAGAGIYLWRSGGLAVSGLAVRGTRLRAHVVDEVGVAEVGDGLRRPPERALDGARAGPSCPAGLAGPAPAPGPPARAARRPAGRPAGGLRPGRAGRGGGAGEGRLPAGGPDHPAADPRGGVPGRDAARGAQPAVRPADAGGDRGGRGPPPGLLGAGLPRGHLDLVHRATREPARGGGAAGPPLRALPAAGRPGARGRGGGPGDPALRGRAGLLVVRARIEGNRDVGVGVFDRATSLVASDLVVAGTRESACAGDTCVEGGDGSGMTVVAGSATLTRFALRGNAFVGLQVIERERPGDPISGRPELHAAYGVIRDNVVGLNLKVPGLELASAFTEVELYDNVTDFSAATLPAPDASAALAAAR